MTTIDVSDEFMELIFFFVDYGIDCVRDGGTLVPFMVVHDEKGERHFNRYALPTLEDGLARAKKDAGQLPVSTKFYLVAYDGYYTKDDVKYDAIFVEGAEQGKDFGVRFCQRYKPKTPKSELETLGNVTYLGHCEKLSQL